MEKKTKMIIGLSIGAVVLVMVLVCLFTFLGKNANTEDNKQKETKIFNIEEKLSKNQTYTFSREVNNDNKVTTIRKDDKAYKTQTIGGVKDSYVVKNNDTYLLIEDTKQYYCYKNNDEPLNEISNCFDTVKSLAFTTGNEKIDEKEYYYEEFLGFDGFLINSSLTTEDDKANAKTKFYFDGNKLSYIKTIIGDKEELAKVTISYQADEKMLDIPAGYENGEK